MVVNIVCYWFFENVTSSFFAHCKYKESYLFLFGVVFISVTGVWFFFNMHIVICYRPSKSLSSSSFSDMFLNCTCWRLFGRLVWLTYVTVQLWALSKLLHSVQFQQNTNCFEKSYMYSKLISLSVQTLEKSYWKLKILYSIHLMEICQMNFPSI